VKQLAAGRQELIVNDRLKPVVGEFEPLPDSVQHTPADEFLDRPRR